MAEGRFRKDLYFRLNVARIHLPALRERKEDLPALIDHYIREFSGLLGREVDGISQEALVALLHHDWPGNVREVRNVVEAVFTTVRSHRISLADLPEAYRRATGHGGTALQPPERDRLLAALSATKWNKSKTPSTFTGPG
jgi:transcriptional regulator with PAS, ATPase and Fis domain